MENLKFIKGLFLKMDLHSDLQNDEDHTTKTAFLAKHVIFNYLRTPSLIKN